MKSERLYAMYPQGAMPQTYEMLMAKAFYHQNQFVGEYDDGYTVWKVWFLDPPPSQEEADRVAQTIAKNGGVAAETIIPLAVLGIAAGAAAFRWLWNSLSKKSSK